MNRRVDVVREKAKHTEVGQMAKAVNMKGVVKQGEQGREKNETPGKREGELLGMSKRWGEIIAA